MSVQGHKQTLFDCSQNVRFRGKVDITFFTWATVSLFFSEFFTGERLGQVHSLSADLAAFSVIAIGGWWGRWSREAGRTPGGANARPFG